MKTLDIAKQQGELSALERRVEEIRELMAPLNTELTTNLKRQEILREYIAIKKSEAGGFTPEEIINFDPRTECQTLYKARAEFAAKLGMHQSGYTPHTNQMYFKFMFHWDARPGAMDAQINRAMESVKTLAAYLKPHVGPAKSYQMEEGDGCLHFGVFEHTLSEHGSYKVHVTPDLKTATLYRKTGLSRKVKTGTLNEVLAYVAQYHYYDEA